MANVYATKSGNWSDTTVWNTGALPTSADDVYSNTFTVTIDQDVTVLSLRNTSTTGVAAGGGFTCSTARTITATSGGLIAGAANLLTLSHTSGTTITVNATITGGNVGIGCVINSTGTTNITGNCTGGTGASGYAVNVTGAATTTITGNLTGGSATTSHGCLLSAAASTTTVVGNLVASLGGNAAYGISCQIGTNVTITGSLTGGYGVSSAANTYALYMTGGSTVVNITGQLNAGISPALYIDGGTATCTGPFICSTAGQSPFLIASNAGSIKLSPITNNEFRFAKSGGGTSSLWSTDVNGGQPSAANVRYGTTYGVGGALTGTLRVPAASSVAYGALVDNTTGTAAVKLQDVAAVVAAQIAAALST